jgi:hypothetical protein
MRNITEIGNLIKKVYTDFRSLCIRLDIRDLFESRSYLWYKLI